MKIVYNNGCAGKDNSDDANGDGKTTSAIVLAGNISWSSGLRHRDLIRIGWYGLLGNIVALGTNSDLVGLALSGPTKNSWGGWLDYTGKL